MLQQHLSFDMSALTDPPIPFDLASSSAGTTPANTPPPFGFIGYTPTMTTATLATGTPSANDSTTTMPKRVVSIGPTRNLRIDHLPVSVDAAELRQMFECFGPVVSHKLMVDTFTGKSRGIAFVQFERDSDANAAVQALDGSPMGESKLVVTYARENTRAPSVPTSRVVLRYVPADTSATTIRHLIVVKVPSVAIVDLQFQPDPRPHLVIVLVTLRSPLEAQMVVDALNRKVKLMPKPEHAHPGIPEYLLSVPVSAKLCDEALLDKTVERVRIAEAQRALTQACNSRPPSTSVAAAAPPPYRAVSAAAPVQLVPSGAPFGWMQVPQQTPDAQQPQVGTQQRGFNQPVPVAHQQPQFVYVQPALQQQQQPTMFVLDPARVAQQQQQLQQGGYFICLPPQPQALQQGQLQPIPMTLLGQPHVPHQHQQQQQQPPSPWVFHTMHSQGSVSSTASSCI